MSWHTLEPGFLEFINGNVLQDNALCILGLCRPSFFSFSFPVDSLSYDREDACMNAKTVTVMAFFLRAGQVRTPAQAIALLDLQMPCFARLTGRIHLGIE